MTVTRKHYPTPAQQAQWQHIDSADTPIVWDKIADIELRLPALLDYCAVHFAERELLVFDEQRITYGAAIAQSAWLARQLLAAGVGKGARVGMLFPNSPQFVVVWLAIVRIGAIAVPISTLSTAAEIRRTTIHADLQLIIATDRFLKHDYIARLDEALHCESACVPYTLPDTPYLRAIWFWSEQVPAWAERVDLNRDPQFSSELLQRVEAEVAPSDPISVIYSSGSTTEPKGVIHSHANFLRSAMRCAACYGYEIDDRTFVSAPLFWVGGLVVQLLHGMVIGMATLSSAHSGSKLLDFIERERATYLFVWPYIARSLVEDPSFAQRDFSFIKGGAVTEAIPPALRRKNQPFFGNALGMTESCGPHSVPLANVPDDRINSMGPLMPGMEWRIVRPETGAASAAGEPGELHVRGDSMMLGLVKRDRADIFDCDGWYRTGDLCSIRDGHLFFHGRTDDQIKTAGANVSPQEVETVLKAIPGVAQAYVYGVPDPRRDVVIGAVVVPMPDVTVFAQQIIAAAAAQLSSYKTPKVVHVLAASELPMTNTGKMDRRKLIGLLTGLHRTNS